MNNATTNHVTEAQYALELKRQKAKEWLCSYTPLPLTDKRFGYTPSHMQTPEHLAETFRRHEPIRVCPIIKQEKKL